MDKFKDRIVRVPLECLISLPEDKEDYCIAAVVVLPRNLRRLLSSAKTGSYITGLAKTFNLPVEKSALISFFILQIVLGDKTLAQLPAMLSADLQISNDVAQKIAQEIERDLFAPIALELNSYLAKKKQKSPSTEGLGNVVDLKNQTGTIKKFPLPPKKY